MKMLFRGKMKNWYLMYVIKKPYFYFCFILIGITLILSLLFTTTVPVVRTYPVELSNSQEGYMISCDEPVFLPDIQSIFVYADKNEAVYHIPNYTVIDEREIIITKELYDLLSRNGTNGFHIDISERSVILFKEIFVQGGKNE